MSLNDNNQETLIERALDLHKNGNISDAISLYLELIKDEENNPIITNNRDISFLY